MGDESFMVCQKRWYISSMELDVTSRRRAEIFNGKLSKEEVSIYNNVFLWRGNVNINKEDMDIILKTIKSKYNIYITF